MTVGTAVGAGLNVLGGLVALKSQSDLLRKRLRDRNAAELATRQASEQIQRGVVGAAQQTQGGVGLLQGLRAADQMQRRALPQIQQAKMADMARQDAFDREQRLRQEKMWAGLASGLAGAGTQLALSDSSPAKPGTGAHPKALAAGSSGALAGMLGGQKQGSPFDEAGDVWSPQTPRPQGTPGAMDLTPPPRHQALPGAEQLTPARGVGSSGSHLLSGRDALLFRQYREMGLSEEEAMKRLGKR